jgi:mRNA-degrading endonuclease toxin of MazEF toxin-antitoxin module
MKEFDEWNIRKQSLQYNEKPYIKFHARDVWWCSYGVNLGSEQDGVGDNFERLCVVVKKLSGSTFVALPLSTKEKLPDFQVKVKVIVKGKVGYVLLDQVRVLDVKRMLRKVGYIDKVEFEIMRSRLKNLL